MSGCPCGTWGTCCNNIKTKGVEHKHDDNGSICEGCYEIECVNCGARCSCDL